jgi:hypothetical protein
LSNQDFEPKDILRRKEELIQSKALTVLHTFDTYTNESGKKDVSLCISSNNSKLILRIGEIRPPGIFINGYHGNHLIIPKIIEQDNKNIPYELEEYLCGTLIIESIVNSEEGKLETSLLENLLRVFWEFQTIGEKIALKQYFSTDNISEHLKKAEKLLKNYSEIEKKIYQYQEFWNKGYPSKWKFSLDNLIMTKDNKVGLIDNAKTGLRYFGYDLGWLIWPLWVTMKTENYAEENKQLEYLNYFSRKVAETAPTEHSEHATEKNFWLMVLERIIGMYYDLANNTKHLKQWKIGLEINNLRTKKYLHFLETLLDYSLMKIK